MLIGYVVVAVALQVAVYMLGASPSVMFGVGFLLALLVGFEAATLRRFTLSRRGWRNVGIVVGDDVESAERRFFDAWVKGERRPGGDAATTVRAADAAPAGARVRRDRPVPRAGSAAVTVAIVDYGSGNLHSAAKAFERAAREQGLDQPIMVTRDPDAVARADRVVLPGVGAFADCRRGLDAVAGMVDALNESVRARGRPFLGICVGMQLMAERGREYEVVEGLGWIAARSTASRRPTRP